MRSSEVRSKMGAAIEEITPDSQASQRDKFRELRQGYSEKRVSTDRFFAIKLNSVPARAENMLATDLYQAGWDLMVFYSDVPGQEVEDRICQDFERISQKLEGLPGTTADLAHIDLIPGGVDELDGILTASYNVDTKYRLTSGV